MTPEQREQFDDLLRAYDLAVPAVTAAHVLYATASQAKAVAWRGVMLCVTGGEGLSAETVRALCEADCGLRDANGMLDREIDNLNNRTDRLMHAALGRDESFIVTQSAAKWVMLFTALTQRDQGILETALSRTGLSPENRAAVLVAWMAMPKASGEGKE